MRGTTDQSDRPARRWRAPEDLVETVLMPRLERGDFLHDAFRATLDDTDDLAQWSACEGRCATLGRLLRERLDADALALYDLLRQEQMQQELFGTGMSILNALATLLGLGRGRQ